MLKSCAYCGKIHDKKYMCKEKEEADRKRKKKSGTRNEDKFRWTARWKRKAEEIKRRDRYMCQMCIREIHMDRALRKYNTHDLSVHHAVSIRDDYSKRLANDNLITLCRTHHEEAETGTAAQGMIRDIISEQERGHSGTQRQQDTPRG